MNRDSWRKLVATLLFGVAPYLVSAGALAANRLPPSIMMDLDRLIPREKWAATGLDRLSAPEQQSLAAEITGLLSGAPSTLGSTAAAMDRSQWRKLKRRMSKDDVKKLLGEPDRISVSRFFESWYYASGGVTFDGKGRVDFWSEP